MAKRTRTNKRARHQHAHGTVQETIAQYKSRRKSQRHKGTACGTEIIFQVEEDSVDGGYVASAIGFGITTQAETIPQLKDMILDALECHFDDPADRPKLIRLHFIREETFSASTR